MVMKGDFDFEAEDDGLSFGLDNEEEEMNEEADSWIRDSIVFSLSTDSLMFTGLETKQSVFRSLITSESVSR